MSFPSSSPPLLPGPSAVALNITFIDKHSLSSCMGRRSLWSIIIGCLTTLLLCTWTAVHPNMPGPRESAVAVWSRRLGSMFLALLAPEAVLMWAIHQFSAAQAVQERFQEKFQDGTLELRVKPHCDPQLISTKALLETHDVVISIPEKRTPNWLEKLSSLCSSISTTFHRPYSHIYPNLSSSHDPLEPVEDYRCWTLKHSFFALMGGFMLFTSEDPDLPRKGFHPLSPDELLEFLEENLVQMSMVSKTELDGRSKGDLLSKAVAIMQLMWFIVQLVVRAVEQLPTTQLEISTLGVSIIGCFMYAFWWHKPKDTQIPVPVYWKSGELPKVKYSTRKPIEDFLHRRGVKENLLGDLFVDMLRPLFNLCGVETVSQAAIRAHRVPCFGGYSQLEDKKSLQQALPAFIVGGLAAVMFGGIHCIAWSSAFPTHIEQLLWRISALALAVIPGLDLLALVYLHLIIDDRVMLPYATATAISVVILHTFYICFRLVVMVLTLLSLRSLPDGVYDQVWWTTLMPHW